MFIRILKLLFGGACYVFFLAVFAYAIGFVGAVGVPKTIDSGPIGPIAPSLAIDAALLGVFAVQHSAMARPAFKRWLTRSVSPDIERSLYVLMSSLALALVFWQWRPAPTLIWETSGIAHALVFAAFASGWVVVLLSTFMLSHFELFGLAQIYAAFAKRSAPLTAFRTPMLYGLVRHPIMLGFIIAFWAAPTMTLGHLAFAIATTLYILIALQFEERDLLASFPAAYQDYRRRVPLLVPFTRR